MASKVVHTLHRKVAKWLAPKHRGKPVEDVYELGKAIGEGNYSKVKVGTHKKTGDEVALKIIEKSQLNDYDRENVMVEVEMLKKVGGHPNIINLKEVFEDKKRIVLVMELMKGGELLNRVRQRRAYGEKDAAILIRKMISAIAHLHRNGVVHRDLKLENMLFTSESDDAELKIADFGFACFIGDGVLDTPCGSPAYVAPEIVKEEEYNKSVDMWSLGVILYILLCGFPPFYHENTDKMFAQIEKGAFDFPDPHWTKISQSAKDLITRLLKVESKERLTADEALRHPWLNQRSMSSASSSEALDTLIGGPKGSYESTTSLNVEISKKKIGKKQPMNVTSKDTKKEQSSNDNTSQSASEESSD